MTIDFILIQRFRLAQKVTLPLKRPKMIGGVNRSIRG